MKPLRISVVSQSYRDFDSFGQKLKEAEKWMGVAADQGADLVIYPELMNCYCGDGPGNPRAMKLSQMALRDWKAETEILFDAAAKHGVDFVIPLVVRENDELRNSFFMVDSKGQVLGRYDKMQPTQGELNEGILPGGNQPLIDWRGLKVGGAICFDTNFDEVFRSQAEHGADFFIVPSLWPGGSFLPAYATRYAAPIALAYPAWSKVIDLDGRTLIEGGYRSETLRFGFGNPVYTAEINFNRIVLHADGNITKLDAIREKYGRRVDIRFYQDDSRFILTSLDTALDMAAVAKEFELVDIRTYLRKHEMWR